VGTETIAFDFALTDSASIEALAEGAALGAYSFDEYKTSPEKKNPVQAVEIVTEKKVTASLNKPAITTKAVSLVKDLVNTPPNDLYPATFVGHTLAAIKGLPIKSTVWDEKALLKDGFGGIVGVGKGSSRPPRLVKLVYSPTKAKKRVAIVGKGITFDTGGLSLKTGAGMIGMKYDMTGAASTLAIIIAAAELKLNVNITAWLCLAENMPSSTATRPNDVLTIHGGKTVEVLNTDAEGRLVLADGLVAASKEFPDVIVDIATLTGAATTALGTRYTGVMGDTETISHLVELGRATGENFWHMPLPEELRAYLNSDVADIANVKPGNTAGGMLVGATFLKDFVGKTSDKPDAPQIPWIHLDIANTANNAGGAYGCTGAGPTGVAVRTLIDLAESYATA
jgi:leucyl aminopeptidase